MITWKFYSERKGLSLSKFLSDAKTYEEALEKFKIVGLEPPPTDDVLEVMGLDSIPAPAPKKMQTEESKQAAKQVEKQTTVTSKPARHQPKVRKKRRPPKKLASNPPKVSEDNKDESNKNDKKYFRKVFPAKDK